MSHLIEAATPFVFGSEAGLVRWTGYRADDLMSFLRSMEKVSGSSIYYHFYQSLYRRHFLTVDYMHDFARWAQVSLNLPPLAERLAQVDPTDFDSLAEARQKMIAAIRSFVGEAAAWVRVPASAPFYFLEQDSFVFETGYRALTLREFEEALTKVAEGSIYYHLIEARIRLGMRENDFSAWLEQALGEKALAERIRAINLRRRPIGSTRQRVRAAVVLRLDELESSS